MFDDDDFFDFDNENFLQGIFDTNKFRKANQTAEFSVTKSSTKETDPSENVNVSGNLTKSNSNKDSPEAASTVKRSALPNDSNASSFINLNTLDKSRPTSFQKSPCRPQNNVGSRMISLTEHLNVNSNKNAFEMGNKAAQNTSINTLDYQTKGEMSREKRPSPTSPRRNGTACKRRSLDIVESPKTPIFENNQFLDRIGTLISTTSKTSSASISVPAKRNKRLSERLGLSNQSSGALLENKSWKNMLSESDIYNDVLAQFNINWAIKMSGLNLLPNDQVPILIVSLKTINETSKGSHFVTLQDKTGEMEGDIHWINSRFQNVKPGDVLLLREATLFSPSPGVKKHCVIIIPNNIICVWQSNTEEERYCVFEKQHLVAKVRLWLRESVKNYTGAKNKEQTCQPISNACINTMHPSQPETLPSLSRSTSNQSKPNILEEEESLWEDDTFEEIIQEDNFDDIFKEDETDELLATLNF